MTHSTFLILTAFTMGIFGGAHCIGMCGGIVCALSYSCQNKTSIKRQSPYIQMCYSLGRITTYTLLGGITGTFGFMISKFLGSSSVYVLRYLTALFIILIGFYIAGWWMGISTLEKAGRKIWQPLSRFTQYLLPVTTLKRAFALGSLWGLLPCGLVYSALLYTLSVDNWIVGTLIMFAFGLGTLPAMLLVGAAMQSYRYFLQQRMVRVLSGVTMIAFGVVSLGLLVMHSSLLHGGSCH